MTESLTQIGRRMQTDKVSSHSYTSFYEALLEHRRDDPVRLLEIGIGGYEDTAAGGASLRMWKAYFPRGQITGLDHFDKRAVAEERIHIEVGDQSDRALLLHLARERGPFDVVIDDGSHRSEHVIVTFRTLFPTMRSGGIYVVEDTQTSYWPAFGGSLRRRARRTTMGYFKDRLDGLNHAEMKLPRYRASVLDLEVFEIRARHNIIAVIKGDNSEPSNVNRPNPIGLREWMQHDLALGVVLRLTQGTGRERLMKYIRRRLQRR